MRDIINRHSLLRAFQSRVAGTVPALLSVLFLFPSWSKDVLPDDASSPSPSGSGTLSVLARSESSSVPLSYPVNVYLFDPSGKCVGRDSLSSGETSVRMSLHEGSFTVLAVAGASSSDYELPSSVGATSGSVVRLRPGKSHGDIMTGHNDITLVDGESNTLTLGLSRRVMEISSVTMDNVPVSVTSVSVLLRPLCDDLRLDGSFGSSSGECVIPLSRRGDSRVWAMDRPFYHYGASGPATVTVRLSFPDGVRGYSYSCGESLSANYRISIAGRYTSSGVQLSGTLLGEDWAGVRDISFDFGGSSSDGEGQEPPVTPDTPGGAAAPSAGSLFEGSYVLSSTSGDDGSTVVTLMGAATVSGLSVSENDSQESLLSAVMAAMPGLLPSGDASGWDLPTVAQLSMISSNLGPLSAGVGSHEGMAPLSSSDCYFVRTSSGEISAYYLGGGFEASRLLDDDTVLRLFKTLVFK